MSQRPPGRKVRSLLEKTFRELHLQVRDRDLPPSLPFPRLLSPSLTFLLPDDLPQTAKRYGSFYNIHAHQFRATAPKTNLYM